MWRGTVCTNSMALGINLDRSVLTRLMMLVWPHKQWCDKELSSWVFQVCRSIFTFYIVAGGFCVW